jgi:hypothetical protein
MKNKTIAKHRFLTKEKRRRMKVEEHERKNVRIQCLSPRHDGIPAKK